MSTARTITDQILDLLAESEEGRTVVALSRLMTGGKIRPTEPEYKPLTVGPIEAQFVESRAYTVPRPGETKFNMSPTEPSSIRSHFAPAVTDIKFIAVNGRVSMVVCHEVGSTTLWLPQDATEFLDDLTAAHAEAVRQQRQPGRPRGAKSQ